MCVHCKFNEWIDTIDEMLDDTDFEFAIDTLCKIQKWVRDKGHITEGQIIAVENIQACKGRFDEF